MGVNIELYKRQHAQALEFAGDIAVHTGSTESVVRNATAIRSSLAKLASTLSVHLEAEDKFLYPSLMKSANAATAATADRFWNEMGGLSPVIEEFFLRWGADGALEKTPDEFLKDCKVIFEALSTRIDAEESELYPLAHKAA